MRKQILGQESPPDPTAEPGELDISALATALVSSEAAEHPVENAFDGRRGPGGSRWIAEVPGEQTLILAFDDPQTLRRVVLEIEEPEAGRTQELQLSVSEDGGRNYRELIRQEYTFSPPGTTFEREDWSITAERVTHLRLSLKPDKGGRPCRAALTSLRLW